MSRIPSQLKQKDDILIHPPPLSPVSSFSYPYSSTIYEKGSTPSPSSSVSRISPTLLLIIVILAIIFFISGLLHLLVRFLMKRPSSLLYQSGRYIETSGSNAFQRQLQQLFRLHDRGLDQAFIDALPVFTYKDIVGLKEPFDCAVCLSEFSENDQLRLLVMCSHAFHINCIDTWLLSNSTCPLCRGTLLSSGLPLENPVQNGDDPREASNTFPSEGDHEGCSSSQKPVTMEETGSQRRVFPVRLGKFRSLNNEGTQSGEREQEGTSSSYLDARRCYSMGHASMWLATQTFKWLCLMTMVLAVRRSMPKQETNMGIVQLIMRMRKGRKSAVGSEVRVSQSPRSGSGPRRTRSQALQTPYESSICPINMGLPM
ncbi:RING-H2 finger protein ATL46 [Vitis vinifera]|uniref:RING-type E3 ubiquitin transferase n=1 Tax=Vitis vinifera TaxID=29760 RepID=A0A438KBB8_VITVI|nr:RING-H2 finger protein ATL46 [Vitis vinifera]